MKKKNNKMKKITAFLATALMAASATGISTSAQGVKAIEAVKNGKAAKSITRSTKKSARVMDEDTVTQSVSNTISIGSVSATPGEIIDVPIIMNTNNTGSCFDFVIEYDSRLSFVGTTGTQASCDFENESGKFVSMVGWSLSAYEDGEAFATLMLKVPEDAGNGSYKIKFSQINNFSNQNDDFEEYGVINGSVVVTGGVEKQKENCLEISSVSTLSGGRAIVDVVPYSNNNASCYDMVIEYDPRLTLVQDDVTLAQSSCVFEKDGRAFVSLVGFTVGNYTDGEAIARLNFQVPEDCDKGDTFFVRFDTVNNFASTTEEMQGYSLDDGAVTILGKDSKDGYFSNYKVIYKYDSFGNVIGSKIALRGDANGDGKADIRDAAKTASHCAKIAMGESELTEEGEVLGDVDDNGKNDIRDASRMAKRIAFGYMDWNFK